MAKKMLTYQFRISQHEKVMESNLTMHPALIY